MKGKKISLEEYLQFFHFAKQVDLSVNQGNQILSMHGFRKVKVKTTLNKAMESLDLINLSRSTLTDEEICSCALMNLEEIIEDVGELDWKDCCITSFETVDFSSGNQLSNSDLSLAPNSGSNHRLGDRRSASGNLRKRKKDTVRVETPKQSLVYALKAGSIDGGDRTPPVREGGNDSGELKTFQRKSQKKKGDTSASGVCIHS